MLREKEYEWGVCAHMCVHVCVHMMLMSAV